LKKFQIIIRDFVSWREHVYPIGFYRSSAIFTVNALSFIGIMRKSAFIA
jgi:hypothetical protein